METCTSPYVKQISSGNWLYDAGSSNPMLWDSLEGWDGVGGGREAQKTGHIRIPTADSWGGMTETTTIQLSSN